jgi:hypothetical protein
MYHFYHLYCGTNAYGQEECWKESVGIHMNALRHYGLIDHLSGIYVGLVGQYDQRQAAKEFLTDNDIIFNVVEECDYGFEQVTQNKLYDFSHHNDGYILYGHSKGSFNFTDQNRSWCKSMIYFNIVRWQEAISYLTDVDAVGCDWHDFSNQDATHIGKPHTGQRWFAGTYWWSKLNRIKDIGHEPTMHTRWDAEVWIGQMPDIKIYNMTRADGPTPHWVTEW